MVMASSVFCAGLYFYVTQCHFVGGQGDIYRRVPPHSVLFRLLYDAYIRHKIQQSTVSLINYLRTLNLDNMIAAFMVRFKN